MKKRRLKKAIAKLGSLDKRMTMTTKEYIAIGNYYGLTTLCHRPNMKGR